jgi:hypothetical protein
MIGSSTIKILKTGAEGVGHAHVRSPASDLERWPEQGYAEAANVATM